MAPKIAITNRPLVILDHSLSTILSNEGNIKWYLGGHIASSNFVLALLSLDNRQSALLKFLWFDIRGLWAMAKRFYIMFQIHKCDLKLYLLLSIYSWCCLRGLLSDLRSFYSNYELLECYLNHIYFYTTLIKYQFLFHSFYKYKGKHGCPLQSNLWSPFVGRVSQLVLVLLGLCL